MTRQNPTNTHTDLDPLARTFSRHLEASNKAPRTVEMYAKAVGTRRTTAGWGEILGDATVAAAMLARLLHRSVVLVLDLDGDRLCHHHARTDTLRRTTTGTRNPLR
jgi:redox-regulated HSP33 family molecular chaperone